MTWEYLILQDWLLWILIFHRNSQWLISVRSSKYVFWFSWIIKVSRTDAIVQENVCSTCFLLLLSFCGQNIISVSEFKELWIKSKLEEKKIFPQFNTISKQWHAASKQQMNYSLWMFREHCLENIMLSTSDYLAFRSRSKCSNLWFNPSSDNFFRTHAFPCISKFWQIQNVLYVEMQRTYLRSIYNLFIVSTWNNC